jgi:hypothetical protein
MTIALAEMVDVIEVYADQQDMIVHQMQKDLSSGVI